jgi:hypothetical protein
VDLPREAVSGGQSLRSRGTAGGAGVDLEGEVEEPAAAAANRPAIEDFPEDSGPVFFFPTLAQSCHELQTLQTLPSASSMSPGGRLGWVSLVVRSGCVDPEDWGGKVLG